MGTKKLHSISEVKFSRSSTPFDKDPKNRIRFAINCKSSGLDRVFSFSCLRALHYPFFFAQFPITNCSTGKLIINLDFMESRDGLAARHGYLCLTDGFLTVANLLFILDIHAYGLIFDQKIKIKRIKHPFKIMNVVDVLIDINIPKTNFIFFLAINSLKFFWKRQSFNLGRIF